MWSGGVEVVWSMRPRHWEGGQGRGQQHGRSGYGPVRCRADWQGAACPTCAWRTLSFHSWSCSSVTFISAGPSMPLTIKVCA